MKYKFSPLLLTVLCIVLFLNSGYSQTSANQKINEVIGKELQVKDSIIFDIIFNSCDVQRLSSIYSKDFKMMHDYGMSSPTTGQTYSDFEQSLTHLCNSKADGSHMRRDW